MARKKQEIALQRELETQEEWEECLAMEGLWVVDVYQEWCGPCQALQGNFRKLKNELGDPLLQYAIAKADTIDALEQYRGRCEPTFLFFAGGILVSFVHGANAPLVLRSITEQLAHEHKVIEGNAERKEVKDTVMTRSQEKELQRKEEEAAFKEAQEPKKCTVCIVKPDAVAAGKVDEIVQELTSRNIEIVAQETRDLLDEEARDLYADLAEEEYFDELIKFICSGPSHVMVLTSGTSGATVVDDVRGLLGPKNVEEAKESAPDSLRARYGDNGYINALHGSSSEETAAREMAFFFPNLAVPTYQKKKENIQRTLALIRPEAFAENKDQILENIKKAGFTISIQKELRLTKEEAQDFYKEHAGQPYFEQLAESMSSGTVLALGLARDEAISYWRDMLGPPNMDEALETHPDSMRAKFAVSSGVNQFHGSDSEENAKKEYDYFFPMQETVAVVKPGAMGTKEAIIEQIHAAGFRIAARKETTITRDIVEMMYPSQVDKDYFDDLANSMTSGPTLFMVLTKDDAVYGWRQMVGDKDPEKAKQTQPDSIRAMYGTDIVNNAVHGASTNDSAKQTIKAVFGDVSFNPDGTLKGEQPSLDPAVVDPDATVDTTMDETTDDITANTTADVTAGDATMDDTTAQADDTAADGDTTVADTTVADTTVADTTAADETAGDTTVAETEPAPTEATTEAATADATADETAEPTADSTAVTEDATPSADQTATDNQTEATAES